MIYQAFVQWSVNDELFFRIFFVIENFGLETIFDWPHVGEKLFQKGKRINI